MSMKQLDVVEGGPFETYMNERKSSTNACEDGSDGCTEYERKLKKKLKKLRRRYDELNEEYDSMTDMYDELRDQYVDMYNKYYGILESESYRKFLTAEKKSKKAKKKAKKNKKPDVIGTLLPNVLRCLSAVTVDVKPGRGISISPNIDKLFPVETKSLPESTETVVVE